MPDERVLYSVPQVQNSSVLAILQNVFCPWESSLVNGALGLMSATSNGHACAATVIRFKPMFALSFFREELRWSREISAIQQNAGGGCKMTTEDILQIRISLVGIVPPIWRRIQIPSTYSFWDLHVAIQDAMG